jgi:hypothetical protein
VESLEPEHSPGDPLDEAMVLFDYIVARSLSRMISVVACSVEDALDAAQVQR